MTEQERHEDVMKQMRIDTAIKTVGMLIGAFTLVVIIVKEFTKK